MNTELFSCKEGERNKTFTTLNNLASEILHSGVSKRSVIIVLGGGVVGNLGGFLAAILMRGLRFVHVPTTVMHQVDASTGGKQAVNTNHGKNLLGTFYEPEFIYNDISAIESLPQREVKSGIAEVIKHALCESKELLELLNNGACYKDILLKTIEHKIKILDEDPRELNKGFILIYGHTLGHVIEILMKGKLLHGEAISIGMILAADIAEEMNIGSRGLKEHHLRILSRYNLPTTIPPKLSVDEIIRTMFFDKKERDTNMTFCLLEDIGKVYQRNNSYSVEVPIEIIKSVLERNY